MSETFTKAERETLLKTATYLDSVAREEMDPEKAKFWRTLAKQMRRDARRRDWIGQYAELINLAILAVFWAWWLLDPLPSTSPWVWVFRGFWTGWTLAFTLVIRLRKNDVKRRKRT